MFHESESIHGEIDQLLAFQPDSLLDVQIYSEIWAQDH